MLVITRRVDEKIRIGPDITITIVRIGPGNVRIGIEAPSTTGIARVELLDADQKPKPRKTEDSE
jgi:carbon storage regulator